MVPLKLYFYSSPIFYACSALSTRYAIWVKKNKLHREIIRNDLEQNEALVRSHDEFDDVRADDLAALADFRSSLGLKESPILAVSDAFEGVATPHTVTPTAVRASSVQRSSLSRRSLAGSIVETVSVRSRVSSAHSSLPPLYEEDSSTTPRDNDEEGATSVSSPLIPFRNSANKRSQAVVEDTQTTFDGVMIDDSNEDALEDELMSRMRKGVVKKIKSTY